MQSKRKLIVMAALTTMAGIVVAFTKPVNTEEHFKNLKVLPKKISSKQLSKIMVDVFTDELGVSCNFCHAEEKGSTRLDYASDSKPEKEIARAMMRMTMGINRKYFRLKHAAIGDSIVAVSCVTCHNGKPHPDQTTTP
jgi:hypothetical protein